MWIDGFKGFGLFTVLTNFIGYAGWKSKEAKENRKSFKRTYDPIKNTYLDMYGIERRPNGEYCKTLIDSNGDLVQKNKYYKTVRNFSKEKRFREASSPNATVIKMSEENLVKFPFNEPTGIRYKDKETNEYYVIRAFRVEDNNNIGHCVYFYMNTCDASLKRITDGEKKYGTLKDNSIINRFIIDFNEKQRTQRFILVTEKYHEYNRRDEDKKGKILI